MQDVRYAIRTLRRSPGFRAVAVVTLALGIGATTAIYSVVDTILLQPLPFAGGDRLVRVVENVPGPGGGVRQRGITYPDFLEWRARTTTLTDAVAVSGLVRIVLTLVLGQGAWLAAVGIACGLGGAVAASRLLQGMLFGITPLDPTTFAAVSLAFAIVAMAASYLPARHATTVDPMIALRTE